MEKPKNPKYLLPDPQEELEKQAREGSEDLQSKSNKGRPDKFNNNPRKRAKLKGS